MEPLAWSALSFCLGLILGHWLAIGRDNRKEFNDAAAPVRAWVTRQMAFEGVDLFPFPPLHETDAFLVRLSPRKQVKFKSAWRAMVAEYEKGRRQDPKTGDMSTDGAPGALPHLHTLERLTRPR